MSSMLKLTLHFYFYFMIYKKNYTTREIGLATGLNRNQILNKQAIHATAHSRPLKTDIYVVEQELEIKQ